MTDKLTKTNSKGSTDLVIPSQFDEQLKFFAEIAKGVKTGIETAGDALLIYQKAKELGIGWGNALSHMHVVNGKPGMDIHIIKAILLRPGSGVRWTLDEDYIPVYNYYDGKNIFTEATLPTTAQIVTTMKSPVDDGKFPVVLMPTNVGTKETPVWQVLPVDYRTSYTFFRKKKDIDGEWITEKVIGKFSWSEALAAQLPFDKKGEINPDSAWQKYRKLMINTRAFTFGAREIANDLLMGNYESSELFDITKEPYEVKEEAGEVTILESKSPVK